MSRDLWHVVRTVACPFCGRRRGLWCVTSFGVRCDSVHAARIKTAAVVWSLHPPDEADNQFWDEWADQADTHGARSRCK